MPLVKPSLPEGSTVAMPSELRSVSIAAFIAGFTLSQLEL
jgi:hypothetical protein